MKKTFLVLLTAFTCYSCSTPKNTVGENTSWENKVSHESEINSSSKAQESVVEIHNVEPKNDKMRKESSIAATRNFNLSGVPVSEL